ncbi:MAG: hypothetical protein HYS75_03750 [Nitrosopumilales archaeon]|jgi:hypothetical protein|nr:hypothetical protein [Nitrosopumilales archaeon]
MAVEKYVAAASLGLFVIFVGEIITLYDFMIEPQREVEPAPKVLQFISIGIAPALVLTGTSFIMAKKYGSKQIGAMIIAGGAVLLVGMSYAYTLLDKIEPNHLVFAVSITPPLFISVSIPVMVVGILLLREKKKRPKKEYF